MKKWLGILLVAIMCVSLAGCGETATKELTGTYQYGETATKDLTGAYRYVGAPLFYPENIVQWLGSGRSTSAVISIDAHNESDITYTVSSGGSAIIEEGSTTDEGTGILENDILTLKSSVRDSTRQYIYKENCLIWDDDSEEAITILQQGGSLPTNNTWSKASIEFETELLNRYVIEFFDDGHCEIESQGPNDFQQLYCEGTYEVNDDVFWLNITYGSCELFGKYTGSEKMGFYIKDGKMHYYLYQR